MSDVGITSQEIRDMTPEEREELLAGGFITAAEFEAATGQSTVTIEGITYARP